MRSFLTSKKVAILIATVTFFTGCGDSGKSIQKTTPISTPTPSAMVSDTPTPSPTSTPAEGNTTIPTPTPTSTNSGGTKIPLPF